jgi:hypothetical protein
MITLAELIKEHCADLGHNYPAIAEKLNERTTIDNPTPRGEVLVPLSLTGLFTAVEPAEAFTLIGLPGFIDLLKDSVNSGDREGLGALLLVASAILSPESQAGVMAKMSETMPDPSWTATILGPSIAQAAGLGRVTPSQVQGVLNP